MRKRVHSKERSIAEINEDDFRVRVLGTIVEINREQYEAVIDDGTARAVLQFSEPEQFANLKEGMFIRVIGRLIPGDEKVIDVEILQDFSRVDIGLYKQLKYIEEKIKEKKYKGIKS